MKKISIIGKSTVSKDSDEFKIVQDLAKMVVSKGFGVIHGGYSGGMMEAVSMGANEAIQEFGLPKEYNLGVPEERFDKDWPRVVNAYFSEPAKDIFDRLRMVISGDILVVTPVGGDGTALELDVVIHENLLSVYSGEKIKPIIFVETETGTQWKEFLKSRNLLATSEKVLEKDWIYFTKSVEEVMGIVSKIF